MLLLYLRKHPELSSGQAPSPPSPRADEGLFPRISQPSKHVDWDLMTQKPKFHPLNLSYQPLHGLNTLRMGLLNC